MGYMDLLSKYEIKYGIIKIMEIIADKHQQTTTLVLSDWDGPKKQVFQH